MRSAVAVCGAVTAVLSAVPLKAEPATPTMDCALLGEPARVSTKGKEQRLLERVEELTRTLRGAAPPAARVAAAFQACSAGLSARGAPVGRPDEPLPATVLSGWQLVPQGSRLRLEVGGRQVGTFPLGEATPRLARRVVSSLVRALGLERDSAREAREILWFLWFEAYVAAQGQRYDHYTYVDELAQTRARHRGRSYSIGIDLARGTGVVEVLEVRDPALAAQGVRAGDRLLALDGHHPASLTDADWERYLLAGAPFDYRLSTSSAARVGGRALATKHPSLLWARLGRAVYVRIRRFSTETETELRRVLRQVSREDTTGLILDLRQDPGGRALPGLVDFFLKPGQTCMTWMSQRDGRVHNVSATVEYYDLPLTVLVDQDTASMAEVLAAAVKQYGRGVLVGQRTYGKGVGQTTFTVMDEGELALVSDLYYYPGTTTTWDGVGLQPDIETPPAGEELVQLLGSPALDLERQLTVDEALKVALSRQEAKR